MAVLESYLTALPYADYKTEAFGSIYILSYNYYTH